MANRRGRREPVFDAHAEAGALDLSLSPEDRAGGHMGRSRREAWDDEDEEPARPRATRSRKPQKPKRRGGSILGRLFYFAVVLGLWAFIGVAGVIAYYASQLPPIDQLSVPKRPPNIAILARDGTLLANSGETSGRAISLKELPPYLPKAFIAIEDRRFREHFGID